MLWNILHNKQNLNWIKYEYLSKGLVAHLNFKPMHPGLSKYLWSKNFDISINSWNIFSNFQVAIISFLTLIFVVSLVFNSNKGFMNEVLLNQGHWNSFRKPWKINWCFINTKHPNNFTATLLNSETLCHINENRFHQD